jgi:hypothetical protein
MAKAEKDEELKFAGARELNVLAKIKHHIRETSQANQKAIAEIVGVSPSSLSLILGGVRPMKLSVLLTLIDNFELDPRILAKPGFYSKKIKKSKNQVLFERILDKLQKIDSADDRYLEVVESYLDGITSANEVKRKRKKK